MLAGNGDPAGKTQNEYGTTTRPAATMTKIAANVA
jgi:hypothetical protein